MKDVYLLMAGHWPPLGDDSRGWDLIRCLRSPDPTERGAAEEYLVQAGLPSLQLLQGAVAAGVLEGKVAAGYMLTFLVGMSGEDTAVADRICDC